MTWTTNIETTEQVAYGDNSLSDNSNLGDLPTYGYDSVNDESNFMVKEHSVIISGLTDGIPYYFRLIADRAGSTGEKVGIEVTYKPGKVKGVEDPVENPKEPCNYLLEYIKLGAANNPVEVMKIETFLNVFEGEKLAVNGIYEQVDFDAVSRFQEKYGEQVLAPWKHDSATGYVYITYKKRVNEIYCQRDFPLTDEQKKEIDVFAARFRLTPVSRDGEISDNEEAIGGDYNETGTNLIEDSSDDEQEDGSVAGIEDETSDEEFSDNSAEERDETSGYKDVLLISGDEDETDDDTSEDGLIVKTYQNMGFWTWFIILLVIGLIAYYFIFIAKGNKKNEEL